MALGDREAVLRLHRERRFANEIDDFGLLAVAVRVNRLDMVATLLDLGLDPNEPVANEIGGSRWPLWFAAHVRPARNRRVAAGPRRCCSMPARR